MMINLSKTCDFMMFLLVVMQCTLDLVVGQAQVATLSEWLLYLTFEGLLGSWRECTQMI